MFPLILATVLVSLPLVPPQVKDAQSLYEWERANMTYQKGDSSYWKKPEETLKDKGGRYDYTYWSFNYWWYYHVHLY